MPRIAVAPGGMTLLRMITCSLGLYLAIYAAFDGSAIGAVAGFMLFASVVIP